MDLKELNIYANTLYITDLLHVRQTQVTIHCKDLFFTNPAACVKTTPLNETIINNVEGEPAGNITCYAYRLSAPGNYKRFDLEGESGNMILKRGNPGSFTSNHSIDSKVIQHGYTPISPNLADDLFSWLHPHYLRLVVQNAREKYLYGDEADALKITREFLGYIQAYKNIPEWDTNYFDVEKEALCLDLEHLENTMLEINSQYASHLDYFGNPKSWAPLLSFEANTGIYEDEVAYALRVLYINQWILDKAKEIETCEAEAKAVLENNSEELIRLKEEFLQSVDDLDETIKDLLALETSLDSLNTAYDAKIAELKAKAENNVRWSAESILRATGNIAGKVCQMVPGPIIDLACGGIPIGSAINVAGAGMTIASKLDYDNLLSMENLSAASEGITSGLSAVGGLLSGIKSTVTQEFDKEAKEKMKTQAKEKFKKFKDKVPTKQFSNIGNELKQLTVPQDRIDAEFEKLKAQSPVLKELIERSQALSKEKGEKTNRYQILSERVTLIPNEMGGLLLANSAMDSVIYVNEGVVDSRAKTYLEELNNRAWDRLLKYHYYLALAYQYRFLEPYPHPLDLKYMKKRIDTIVGTSLGGLPANPDDYPDLSFIFEDELREITSNLVDEYNTGLTNEQTDEQITYPLSANELAELNENGILILNLWEDGTIPLKYAASRISDARLELEDFDIRVENQLSSGNLKVQLDHSGNSTLINDEDGGHYGFSQYKDEAAIYYEDNLLSPISWSWGYSFYDQDLVEKERSEASQSLMRKFLGETLSDSILVFTRPAVWGDMKLTIEPQFIGHEYTEFTIEALKLKFSVDYSGLPNKRNIVVNVNHKLKPLIQCSRPDLLDRSHGFSPFTRTFEEENKMATFTAPLEYGVYEFDYWLKSVKGVNASHEKVYDQAVDVNVKDHVFLTAFYKINVPVLSVADTIYLEKDATSFDLQVSNSNFCEHVKMEWFADSESEWFRIHEETTSGVEKGEIKLIVTENEDANERISSLKVYALEAHNPEQEVVVIQKGYKTHIQESMFSGINIYPVPAHDEVHISFNDSQANKDCHIRIHSLDGKLLYDSGRIKSEGTHTVQVNNLADGVYVLSLDMDQRTMYSKIVVN
jgi:hypothetical protein